MASNNKGATAHEENRGGKEEDGGTRHVGEGLLDPLTVSSPG